MPVAATFVVIAVLLALALHWTARATDRTAVTEQAAIIRHAIAANVDQLALNHSGVAIWDETYEAFTSATPDLTWAHDEVGSWLHNAYGHNHSYVLDHADRPSYAIAEGQQQPLSRYYDVAPAIAHLVARVRRLPVNRYRGTEGGSDILFTGTRLPRSSSHARGLALVEGRPAAVSVTRIAPNTAAHALPVRGPLMISVRFLDGEFLTELERRNLLKGARFSAAPRLAAVERAMPIVSEAGVQLGWIVWKPQLPGASMTRQLLPSFALSLVLIAALLAFVVRRLFRSTGALRASETHATHLALHDPLTGLANRALFGRALDERLTAGGRAAVILIDLDRFKDVNDRFGHALGDALIVAVASRLSRSVGPRDLVARLGGDEFAILTTEAEDVPLASLCDAILKGFHTPFDLDGIEVWTGCSMGIAEAPEHARERVHLLRCADIALYEAKDSGRGLWCRFEPPMDDIVRGRSALQAELHAAVALGGQLALHFQPLISSASDQIIGFEALLRWYHPVRGIIPPLDFIGIAEQTGLILPIGDWVIVEAARVAVQWPALKFAINVSPIQFRDPGFVERVMRVWSDAGAHPAQLEVEVTETALLDATGVVPAELARLQRWGARVALDDFGTGASSLSRLRSFAVDRLKIDRSFVAAMNESPEASAIITAIVTLGQALGVEITAEGVEDETQRRNLVAIGCAELQGYLFSRPVPEASIVQVLGATPRSKHDWQQRRPHAPGQHMQPTVKMSA